MKPDLKAYFCLLVCLLIAIPTLAQDEQEFQAAWKENRDGIKTEYIDIGFGTSKMLRSMRNAVQSEGGIQSADSTQPLVIQTESIAVPVDTVTPFLAIGSRLVLTPPTDGLEHIQLEIRSSTDTRQWSTWKTVSIDKHLTVSRDTLVGVLQYLPKATKSVEFRVVLSQTGKWDSRVTLHTLHLSFTSPGATPPEVLDNLRQRSRKKRNRQGQEPRQHQRYAMPEYVSRTGWGCPDGQEPSGPVSLTDVTHQIVHHSAGTNTSSDWPAVVRSIWDYHVNTNGWSDIGYNWLVDPNGIVYQGRGWIDGDDEVQGAHFCGTNSNTMGVCLLGNFEEVSPDPLALGSLEDLLAWKSDENDIDPLDQTYHASSGLNLFTISGHRDGCSTLCPGENLYVQLPEIRENVNMLIGEPVLAKTDISMLTNYPNPFSDATTISFALEKPGNVRITIWDITGKLVEEITDGYYEAENHIEIWRATGFASGIYYCQVEFEQQMAVQKMVLIQ